LPTAFGQSSREVGQRQQAVGHGKFGLVRVVGLDGVVGAEQTGLCHRFDVRHQVIQQRLDFLRPGRGFGAAQRGWQVQKCAHGAATADGIGQVEPHRSRSRGHHHPQEQRLKQAVAGLHIIGLDEDVLAADEWQKGRHVVKRCVLFVHQTPNTDRRGDSILHGGCRRCPQLVIPAG